MYFLKRYYGDLISLLSIDDIQNRLYELSNKISECSDNGGTVYVIGNGGSAATASHVSVDLTKNAKIRSMNFNEADLITCLSNDYCYEDWVTEALKLYSESDSDLIILISCSGASKNLINAAKWACEFDRSLVTLTGMISNNDLIMSNSGGLNLWVNSKSYNQIEIVHHAWLLSVVDLLIGNSEYPATPLGYKK